MEVYPALFQGAQQCMGNVSLPSCHILHVPLFHGIGDYGSCDNAEGETGQTNESTGYASGMSEDHRAGLKKVSVRS